jgi:predicted metal-dependent peptidase
MDRSTRIRCIRQIEDARLSLRLRFPFFAEILSSFDRTLPDMTTKTACVRFGRTRKTDGRAMIEMAINPWFFAILTPEERVGVLQHEVLHAVYGHLYQIPKDDVLRLHNVATDIAINDDILSFIDANTRLSSPIEGMPPLDANQVYLKPKRAGISLIPACLTRSMFSDINVAQDPSWGPIYAQLRRNYDLAKAAGPLNEKEQDQLYQQQMRYRLVNPNPLPKDLDVSGLSAKDLQAIIQRRSDLNHVGIGINSILWLRAKIHKKKSSSKPEQHETPDVDEDEVGGHSDHSHWEEDAESTESEEIPNEEGDPESQAKEIRRRMNGTIANAYRRASAADRAQINKGLRDKLEEMFAKASTYDWRQVFRRLMSNANASMIKVTRARESNRFTGSEGTKLRRLKRIMVAVDTSGSITKEQIAEFFAEVDRIVKSAGEVVVVLFHHVPYGHFKYKLGMMKNAENRKRAPEVQSGATSFRTLFPWIKQYKDPIDGIVVLTDGFGDHPLPQDRPRCMVVWALTEPEMLNNTEMCPWGPRIYVGKDPRQRS